MSRQFFFFLDTVFNLLNIIAFFINYSLNSFSTSIFNWTYLSFFLITGVSIKHFLGEFLLHFIHYNEFNNLRSYYWQNLASISCHSFSDRNISLESQICNSFHVVIISYQTFINHRWMKRIFRPLCTRPGDLVAFEKWINWMIFLGVRGLVFPAIPLF